MAVKIRLARHGRKARPFYHIVAADSRAPRDGKFIEKIGTFNPMIDSNQTELKFDRALFWLQNGAEPSASAKNILQNEGVLYMKHLLGGVKKGAFDQAELEKRFQKWLDEKRSKEEAASSKIAKEKQNALKKRLEEETAINQKREEEIAKKHSELAQEDVAEEAPVTEEVVAEVTEEVTEEVVAEEAPVTEEPAAEEAPESDDAEAKTE